MVPGRLVGQVGMIYDEVFPFFSDVTDRRWRGRVQLTAELAAVGAESESVPERLINP